MAIHTHQLDAAFFALSDPTRRAILARLAEGEATVSELVAPFSLTQPTVSKHLKVLESAGLIEGGRDTQRRAAKARSGGDKGARRLDRPLPRSVGARRFNNLEAHVLGIQNGEK